ncbi:glycosyltransferase [Maribacter aurantiacus]|uniref:Glycosyltransferase n=1 Tax=Maribacter aurantiacus TaxID=1882343 RepID=A0A5R8M4M1_9FLAO|nr:glycosyltransferase [Maribacter aurantiacus]TLF44548.1 glycosyltransferase [Maribacter aurantiacus]
MTSNKIKITFVIPNLSPGGAERILTFLAAKIDEHKFDSELLIIGSPGEENFSTEQMTVTFLGIDRVIRSIPKLVKHIRKRRPNIVMGTLAHVNVILGVISVLFPKIIFVGRQTSIVNIYKSFTSKPVFDWYHHFEKMALSKLDSIICQSEDMAMDCRGLFKIPIEKIHIINNPITDNFELVTNNRTKSQKYRFITVGRLVAVKGHQRVLKVLSQFNKPFNYTIIGDGPLKDELFDLARNYGIYKNINHIPFTNKVSDYLEQSDFFLQGSLTEGFPNALLESCAVGTPAIAFDVPGGTKEIIEHSVNGYLVEDEKDFLRILNDLGTFNPESVSKSVFNKFEKSLILKQYESHFIKLLES